MKKDIVSMFSIAIILLLFSGCIQIADTTALQQEIDNIWLLRGLELPFKEALAFDSRYLTLDESTLNQMQLEFNAIKEKLTKIQGKEFFALNSYLKANAAFVAFLIAEKQAKKSVNALNERNDITIACYEKNTVKNAFIDLKVLLEKANEFNDAMKELQEDYSENLQEFNVLKDNYLKSNEVNNSIFNLNNFSVYLENSCNLEEDLNSWLQDFNAFVLSSDLCLNKAKFNEFADKIKELNEKTVKAIEALKTLGNNLGFKVNENLSQEKEKAFNALSELENIKNQLELVCNSAKNYKEK